MEYEEEEANRNLTQDQHSSTPPPTPHPQADMVYLLAEQWLENLHSPLTDRNEVQFEFKLK